MLLCHVSENSIGVLAGPTASLEIDEDLSAFGTLLVLRSPRKISPVLSLKEGDINVAGLLVDSGFAMRADHRSILTICRAAASDIR
jgi:hypothetical protein